MSSKYDKTIYASDGSERLLVDVYSVLEAFEVTNPAIQHAIKKLLKPGTRGTKGIVQDLKEAALSIDRAVVMEEYKSQE